MFSLKKSHKDHLKNKPHHVKTNSSNVEAFKEKPLDKVGLSNKNTHKYINVTEKVIATNSTKPSKNLKETIKSSNNNVNNQVQTKKLAEKAKIPSQEIKYIKINKS